MAIYHHPPPPVFIGGAQPYAPRKLAPQITAVQVDDPPFQHRERTAVQISIAAFAQWPPRITDPWLYTFMGRGQPLDLTKVLPSLISVDNPPFVQRGRTLAQIAIASWAPFPPNVYDPWAYTFTGGRQPVTPRWLTPSITDVPVNNPPFSHPSRSIAQIAIAAWSWYVPNVPDPWSYTFFRGRQPLTPIYFIFDGGGVAPVNDPPFRHPARTATYISLAAWASYPPNVFDPSYTFLGGRQPRSYRKVTPPSVDNPPFGMREAVQRMSTIDIAWREAEKRNPFVMQTHKVTGHLADQVFICVIH